METLRGLVRHSEWKRQKHFLHLKPWWVCTVSGWTGPSAGFLHFVLQPAWKKNYKLIPSHSDKMLLYLGFPNLNLYVAHRHLQWVTYHKGFLWLHDVPASVPLIDVAEWRKIKTWSDQNKVRHIQVLDTFWRQVQLPPHPGHLLWITGSRRNTVLLHLMAEMFLVLCLSSASARSSSSFSSSWITLTLSPSPLSSAMACNHSTYANYCNSSLFLLFKFPQLFTLSLRSCVFFMA